MFKSAVLCLLFVMSGFSYAGLISADFRTESDLPDFGTSGAKTYQNLGQTIDSGVELNDSHIFANPGSWGGGEVWMDFDPLTNILTLMSRDSWDFQTFGAWMNNILFSSPGEVITGFSFLGGSLVNNNIQPVLSFTDNSLHISYSSVPLFNFTGGQATFLVQTSAQPAAIPEPATLAIFALGLLVVSLLYRRQQR